MGCFSVPIKLTKWGADEGEEVTCDALVDTGAIKLALPSDIVRRLGLSPIQSIRVSTATDTLTLQELGMVKLDILGRVCVVTAIEIPEGKRPLLGAIPLEETDWYVSPTEKKLVPNPLSRDGGALFDLA